MPKENLKKEIRENQKGKCALSGDFLPDDPKLYDTDRKILKSKNGIYTIKNTRAVTPISHMERHGNFRVRPDELSQLKSMIDDREHVMRLNYKINNQLLAVKRQTDELLKDTENFLENQFKQVAIVLKDRTNKIKKWIKYHIDHDDFLSIVMGVPWIGEITVAYCFVYIDLEKANHASSLWKYAGLHASSHERYIKGEFGGGNKRLRSALWNMANSQVKGKGPYSDVYYNIKSRLEKSNKVTKTRNTQGHLIEKPWKDTKPSHRHGAGLRAVMKHFLSDYWFVGRTLYGLPIRSLYVEEYLGHSGIIKPEERGWKY